MSAPSQYQKEYCDTKHEGVEKEVNHICSGLNEVRDSVKTLNNRLWFGLIAIVINIIVAGAKALFALGGKW